MQEIQTDNSGSKFIHIGTTPVAGSTWNVWVRDGESQADLEARVEAIQKSFDRMCDRQMQITMCVRGLSPAQVEVALGLETTEMHDRLNCGATYIEGTREDITDVLETLEGNHDDEYEDTISGNIMGDLSDSQYDAAIAFGTKMKKMAQGIAAKKFRQALS